MTKEEFNKLLEEGTRAENMFVDCRRRTGPVVKQSHKKNLSTIWYYIKIEDT